MQSQYPIQIPNSPAGLTLRQTIKKSGAVSIPSSVSMVYAILIGGAALSTQLTASVNQGWVNAATTCVIGTSSGYSRYGNLATSYVTAAQSITAFTGFTGAGTSGAGALLLYY
jgi:hypothetical protein